MTDRALITYQEMSLDETLTLGKTLAASGYFEDVKQISQAVVKILAGRELGFGPIASMTGINVIKGKVAVGANLMASTIKRDPRYDYRIVELSAKRCDLVFFENGQEVGHSAFTIEEARAAGVGKARPPGKPGTMLEMFPRNLLFARAISNGARWFCPDALGGGPVYTPDELGAPTDSEGEMVGAPAQPVPPAQRDARKVVTELFEDYDQQPTGDPFLNGDYHGAPMDADAYEDLKEDERAQAEHQADVAEAEREIEDLKPEIDLDYVPAHIDEWEPGAWKTLREMAVDHLGYDHTNHVKNTLKQIVSAEDAPALTYRAAWHILQEHQRSKQEESAESAA